MAKHFRERQGVEVTYLFSGRPEENYFDMEVFGDYRCQQGLTFYVDSGKVKYLKTLQHNSFLKFFKEVRALDLSPYDLVITDFEPVTAWAARLGNKPVIGLGHQYAFSHNVPREGENTFSRLLMKYFAPARESFGLHWARFDGPILPPIVEPKLNQQARGLDTDPRKIVVYLPFENQQEVTGLLQRIPQFKFVQYASNVTDAETSNVSLRKANRAGFIRDLCSSRAVISNAGFELISESLQLGLEILVKPLSCQPEQLSNAAALTELGLATRVDQLSIEEISSWLDRLPEAGEKSASINYPDVAAALVEWIVDGQHCDAQELVKVLWAKCSKPMQGIRGVDTNLKDLKAA